MRYCVNVKHVVVKKLAQPCTAITSLLQRIKRSNSQNHYKGRSVMQEEKHAEVRDEHISWGTWLSGVVRWPTCGTTVTCCCWPWPWVLLTWWWRCKSLSCSCRCVTSAAMWSRSSLLCTSSWCVRACTKCRFNSLSREAWHVKRSWHLHLCGPR